MAIWKSCPKSIKIKRAGQPYPKGNLSRTAIYQDAKGLQPFFITYEESTVRAISRHMPMGIGPAHPAYLTISYHMGCYRIWCSYVNETFDVCLWQQQYMPSWCSIPPVDLPIKVDKNA
jgi:hypothetical protein